LFDTKKDSSNEDTLLMKSDSAFSSLSQHSADTMSQAAPMAEESAPSPPSEPQTPHMQPQQEQAQKAFAHSAFIAAPQTTLAQEPPNKPFFFAKLSGGRKRRWFITALLWSLPSAMILTLLASFQAIDPLPALLAFAGILVSLMAIMRRHMICLDVLSNYVDEFARTGKTPLIAPIVDDSLLADLPSGLRRMSNSVKARLDELHAMKTANEAVLDCLPYPLVMLARDLTLVGANPAACELFGEMIVGRNLNVMSRHPALLEAAEKTIRNHEGSAVEVTIPVPVPVTYLVHLEPLSRPSILGMVAIASLHDITALKRSEKMRADFIANASHELRTPLSSLIGFIETLRGPAKDDPKAHAQFLEIMNTQAARMARLVDDLMSLSRIEMIEHTPPREWVEMGAVLRDVIAGLKIQAAEKDMTILYEGPEELPLILGDRDELSQLIQNLLMNAIKYGYRDSDIKILAYEPPIEEGTPNEQEHMAKDPDTLSPSNVLKTMATNTVTKMNLAISVIDQGEGIAREHLPRLTERFYRVDKARSHEVGGTGLGLAIVKHILNRHRGRLDIVSTPGKGSQFTVLLPCYENSPPKDPIPPQMR